MATKIATLKILAALPVVIVLAGCNTTQQASAQSSQLSAPQLSMNQQNTRQQGGFGMRAAYQQPRMRQQQPASAVNNNGSQTNQQSAHQAGQQGNQVAEQMAGLKAFTDKKISKMGERVRRVERAMIRLDRRMQIIERNELSQVSGFQGAGNSAGGNMGDGNQPQLSQNQGQFKPTSYNPNGNFSANGQNNQQSPFARGAAVLSRTPFANRGQKVDTQKLESKHVSISPLQPASSGQQAGRDTQNAGHKLKGRKLASLADKQTDRSADTKVAIWTVNYDRRKIWPDRAELAASSDVVSALREGKPASIFARGARPSSKEFRERVRALSRYLGRVSDLESVPIAAMPADHLNTDTIELVVAN